MKRSKDEKRLLKKVKKMKCGDEMKLHDCDLLCVDKQFYLIIHKNYGIFEKHYKEIEDWIVNGRGFLD